MLGKVITASCCKADIFPGSLYYYRMTQNRQKDTFGRMISYHQTAQQKESHRDQNSIIWNTSSPGSALDSGRGSWRDLRME